MAVQAQYPSNVLLPDFRNRNGQDRKEMYGVVLGPDYALPGQSGGVLNQSPVFNNAGVGPPIMYQSSNQAQAGQQRKRARETPNCGLGQQQMPTVINLADLHQQPNSSVGVVSTGLRLAFKDEQQPTLSSSSLSSSLSSLVSEELSAQLKQQRDEIDQFLRAQGEELRRALAEKRRKHCVALLGAIEEGVARRVREKEAEMQEATRRHAELEEQATQLRIETERWQSKARAQEAVVATLQMRLHQAQALAQDHRGGGHVAFEGCGDSEVGDAESAFVDPRGGPSSGVGLCRGCGRGEARVVLLPCRHLCLCTGCGAAVVACPLCNVPRSHSLEVFMS
ncbi:BOI-related E3 ubiquitin-protein ligase 1 [Amborella trichopoda]|uniref:RING-type domain-containing protein n=1 Tax=Amborella trichopoda TaxID=13333 RepID=U5CQN3_AMBTC|nr:BOI-related E3 ubiquitin-protein ligase 1 [Amborella trichopoda]ERN15486.1 hypothetical protein AMTR_s00048p00028800 [Amborella trichopoda]|eukprot:XP_006854019.1 BOI-related E3 ubiquitin-protein ligase 1 [Amborella trichopoda]